MYPATHAATTPDKPAQIMAGSGEVVTYAQLACYGAVEGFEPYEEVVGAQPTAPLAEELEGADMLYSSGTTGRPKGIRRPLTGLPAGAPDPVTLVCQGLYGATPDSVYLSP